MTLILKIFLMNYLLFDQQSYANITDEENYLTIQLFNDHWISSIFYTTSHATWNASSILSEKN